MDTIAKTLLYSKLRKALNGVVNHRFDCILSIEINRDVFQGQMNNSNLTKTFKLIIHFKNDSYCRESPKERTKKIETHINEISGNLNKFIRYPFHKFEYKCSYVFD